MILSFEVPAPVGDEVAAVEIRLYQSDTQDGVRSQVGVDTVIASLPEDDGVYTWDEPLADETKYTWLTFLSAGGSEGQPALLPPKPVAAASMTVFAYTVDAGLGVVEGVEFTAEPSGSFAAASDKSVIQSIKAETDENGYVEITIPAEAGQFSMRLGPAHKKVDTTGKTGQSLNFNALS